MKEQESLSYEVRGELIPVIARLMQNVLAELLWYRGNGCAVTRREVKGRRWALV